MKKFWIYITLTAVIMQGCQKDDLCNCLENTGSITTETRQLEKFSSLELNNNVDIILTPDTVHYAELTCGKNLADGVKTDVINGRLVVSNINKCNWLRDFKNKFTLNVHYREINHITNNGSGNLSCADTIRPGYLSVESWNGTGQLAFMINGGEIYLKLHTGPADIIAAGKADFLYLYSAGNGFIKAASLESELVFVSTRSTGDCEVFAREQLGVNIGYNGDVFYKGNPPMISKIITGNGNLFAL